MACSLMNFENHSQEPGLRKDDVDGNQFKPIQGMPETLNGEELLLRQGDFILVLGIRYHWTEKEHIF